jgi:adenylosuccinate synthase
MRKEKELRKQKEMNLDPPRAVRDDAAGLTFPSLKYSIMINGVTQLLMMKADVLSIFPTIKICTHYQIERRINHRNTYHTN